jgi:transposase
MARAYSDDLRRKFLEAYDAKEGSLRTLAKRFKVSKEWAFKVSADRKRTGSADRVPQLRRGRKSLVDRPRITALLTARPDMVLRELQTELEAATGQRSSVPYLWRVVRSLGFRLKKSRSTPPSATPKRTAAAVRSS